MNYIHVSILSIAQGITEFLPISSSGHLALIPKLFGFADPGLDLDAFLHLGTLAAAVIYFRQEIFIMLKSFFTNDSTNRKLSLGILLATMPAIIIGFSFKSFFASEFVRSTFSIAITLLLGSVLMYASDLYFKKKQQNKSLCDLSIAEMFFVGLMQTLALFPGTSRSGSTISAGLFTGLSREEAARFSFLVGLPAIAGAGLLSLKDIISNPVSNALDLTSLGLGFVLSFISGYLAIDFMLKFLKNNSLFSFIVYRVILALVLVFINL